MSIFIKKIENILVEAIVELGYEGEIIVERPRNDWNGDYSSNFALMMAKKLGKNPRELATEVVEKIKGNELFENVEIAGPGFINFKVDRPHLATIIKKVLDEKDNFGRGEKKNFKYNLELVSANPTGFLHVGHARNAAIGDSVAHILKFAGFDVETEYYTNDAGNQINVLAVTLFYHYRLLLDLNPEKPEEMYGGDMYSDVAQTFIDDFGEKFKDLTVTEDNKLSDPETHTLFRERGIEKFLIEIKQQLKDMGVVIEYYSSEKEMYENHAIEKMLDLYKELGKTYTEGDALWLRTTEFDDDKDRVLVKANGDYTYITPDIACHHLRVQRSKADKYVNFWGGDHHGYIARMRAGLALLGYDKNILDIDMIQMVRLMKDGEEFKMSKRKGTAVWLVDLLEMVGKDSLRYMLLSKTPSSHMDFDLDLAVQKNSTNPVYYAQYATARCNKLLQKAKEANIDLNKGTFTLLNSEKEAQICILLDSFAKNIDYAASSRLPNIICDFIQSLAKLFHSYYSDEKIYDETNLELTHERLCLVQAVYQTLSNAFKLLDVTVMNEM